MLAAAVLGCGGGASAVGAPEAGAAADAPGGGDAGRDADAARGDAADGGAPVSCDGLPNVAGAAALGQQAIAAEMAAAGVTARAPGAGQDVLITLAEDAAARAGGAPPPQYFASEAELLALPAADSLRRAYVGGDLTPPDWTTQGLVSVFQLSPYTDVFFYGSGDELLVATLRLEACLTPAGPTVAPRELVQRTVYTVPRVSALQHRERTAPFALRQFPAGPAFQRAGGGPFIDRAGGNQTIVDTGDRLHLWLEGYSGATGFVFYATSTDGLAWDFAWDASHTVAFDGLPDLQYWKLGPTVLEAAGAYTIWLEVADESTDQSHLAVATGTDPLHFGAARTIGLVPFEWRDRSVFFDGATYHLYADHAGTSLVHATSPDGLAWTADATPLLEKGASIDDIDGFGVYAPAVVRVGGTLVMFYIAVYGARAAYQSHVVTATSADGLTWQKAPTPVLNQDLTPGGWEAEEIGRPTPLVRGGDVWLYYTGVEGGEPSVGVAIGAGWTP